ncbi:MAG: hypothetical protein OER04_12915, partial [Cyclobacteriaceae bacterium]|nr:hypothetical protein [Cyclobacteriaceae bacterium]
DPVNSDYGWSMGQKGNLFRYHTTSGQLLRVRPQHPEGVPLRFNWNAGIALDPFDNKVVYYGSQYLLKSNDYGASWEVISPDLTTNDPQKQDQLNTGGLTYDNTGAENYTTIISVVPSELEQGVIWVGTDDGNLQVTRDGGKSWTNVIGAIKGVPANTWIPHIHVSKHQKGEAFVVFDDHRRDNWTPYLYHTKDYGRSWSRILNEDDVGGFVYSFVQDPVAPNLYFCGTESGLYVSLDAGSSWSKWINGYPTVPTMDMVIQEREGDLVLGTFGRAFWIMDDLTPLRELSQQGANNILSDKLHVFPPPDAYLVNIGESFGYRKGKIGDALFEGENRPYGALLSYYIPEVSSLSDKEDPLADSVRIEIHDHQGLLRTLYKSPQRGINRTNWELTGDAVRYPDQKEPEKKSAPKPGVKVPPGDYQVLLIYQGDTAQSQIKVIKDPRLELTPQQMKEKDSWIKKHLARVEVVTAAADRLRESKAAITYINKKLKGQSGREELMAKGKVLSDSIDTILSLMFPPEDTQGIYRDASLVVSKLQEASYLMESPLVAWTQNQEFAVEVAHKAVEEILKKTNGFFQGPWQEYRQLLGDAQELLAPNYPDLRSD